MTPTAAGGSGIPRSQGSWQQGAAAADLKCTSLKEPLLSGSVMTSESSDLPQTGNSPGVTTPSPHDLWDGLQLTPETPRLRNKPTVKLLAKTTVQVIKHLKQPDT